MDVDEPAVMAGGGVVLPGDGRLGTDDDKVQKRLREEKHVCARGAKRWRPNPAVDPDWPDVSI